MGEVKPGWVPFAFTMAAVVAILGAVTWALDASSLGTRSDAGPFSFEAMSDAGLKLDERVDDGEIWRLVSAGSVHTGVAHFAVNAIGLLLVGYFFRRVTSSDRRAARSAWVLPAIFITSSSAGFFASYLLRSGASGGASAGVYGVLAAVAGVAWARRRELPERLRWTAPVALTTLSLALVAVVLPNPGMDHAAHVGGWATGIAAGWASERRIGSAVLAGIAVALLLLLATRWL